MTVTILPVQSEEQIRAVRELFQEYAASQEDKPSFSEFEKELAGLPGAYAPPDGRLLMAVENDENVGCVALRLLGNGLCEMKRLYVRPAHRNKGIGRQLVQAIIEAARTIGYEKLRLDERFFKTRLFRFFHFQATNPTWQEPIPDEARWMFDDYFVYELVLRR